jgi:hypothetical protein
MFDDEHIAQHSREKLISSQDWNQSLMLFYNMT